MNFKVISDFTPTGDQPQAIQSLYEGLMRGDNYQTLLGVTGSGKTFTMANVIEKLNRPTLVISHNKTLAYQLYEELKGFFPENAVEYYISYYDYYQPEAFIPSSNTYIEKDLSINQEIEKLRLSATAALLSGRNDVVVVASVSCIYGIGNPEEFGKNVIQLHKGDRLPRNQFLYSLIDILYSRSDTDFNRGNFRVKGDTVDVFIAYGDFAYRIIFFGDEIETIQKIDPETGKKINNEEAISIFPANLFVTGKETLQIAIKEIQDDLMTQIRFFEKEGKGFEAKRLQEKTEFDLEMIREIGYCSGVENYSRYFDRRKPGQRPFCLIDYFPDDFLMIVDESHVTIPQIRGMWGGDRSRKINLVDYGFRLPSALDNRPLTFNEFESMANRVVFVSATPADYELQKSDGIIVEQIIRPTGVLDPLIYVKPTLNQIDDLLNEIDERVKNDERVLITTLTKRMAEELHKFLEKAGIHSGYVHSDVKPMDRVEILDGLRKGSISVLVGVNLLREGLDLPEVSLVAILDADKEGFLRNVRSLVQTMGRAARNENGKVIMYADKMTDSMKTAIDETNRRRSIQTAYNTEHNIIPQSIRRYKADNKPFAYSGEKTEKTNASVAEPVIKYMTTTQIEKVIKNNQSLMEQAAKDLNFMEAARIRDEIQMLKNMLKEAPKDKKK